MKVFRPEYLDFLKRLKKNNNRKWFAAHKGEFDQVYAGVKLFFGDIYKEMLKVDNFDKFQVHRIYRDLRFSKDKTPYRTHFRLYLKRAKPLLRGGYYLYIEPGKSAIYGGFWDPDSADLLRIRKEIASDDKPMRKILSDKTCKKYFGELYGDEIKTVPKGFEKENPGIDLLRKKQFILRRTFTDEEVLKPDFPKEVVKTFKALRPFFDYMSEVLTTDENGVSLYNK